MISKLSVIDYLMGLLHEVPAGEDRDDYHWQLDEATAAMIVSTYQPVDNWRLFGLKVQLVERYGITLVRS